MEDRMSRIGTLMICAATLALGLGCDDGRSGEDGGGIVLMDSGPDTTPDTGTPPGPTDSGVTPASCAISSFMPLPAGCLPRCANSTVGAINSCPDPETMPMEFVTCRTMALQNDPTPDGTLSFPDGSMQPIDCEFCYNFQIQTCIAESCPTEYQAWGMCDPMMSDCTAQTDALNSCIQMNNAGISSCAMPRVSACFDMGSGFLPDLDSRVRVNIGRTLELRNMAPQLF